MKTYVIDNLAHVKMTALNVVGIGKEELQKERESLLEVKKVLEEQLAVLKAEELTLKGILQTQSSVNSNETAAIATVESQGADKGSVVDAETAATLIDASLVEQPSASTTGTTEMPELYLEINSQHTETLEV